MRNPFKKRQEVIYLSEGQGISKPNAREFAERLGLELGIKVVLLPYGISIVAKG